LKLTASEIKLIMMPAAMRCVLCAAFEDEKKLHRTCSQFLAVPSSMGRRVVIALAAVMMLTSISIFAALLSSRVSIRSHRATKLQSRIDSSRAADSFIAASSSASAVHNEQRAGEASSDRELEFSGALGFTSPGLVSGESVGASASPIARDTALAQSPDAVQMSESSDLGHYDFVQCPAPSPPPPIHPSAALLFHLLLLLLFLVLLFPLLFLLFFMSASSRPITPAELFRLSSNFDCCSFLNLQTE
jgi:hypothetical protein